MNMIIFYIYIPQTEREIEDIKQKINRDKGRKKRRIRFNRSSRRHQFIQESSEYKKDEIYTNLC